MDANLLRIDPTTQTVVMDVSLKKTPYWNYNGAKLRARSDGSQVQQKVSVRKILCCFAWLEVAILLSDPRQK
jgi:hypothetical protein